MKYRFVPFLNLSDQPLLPVKGSVFDASGISCFLIPHVNLQLLLLNGRACRITVLYTVNKKRKNPFHFNNVRPSCIYSCYLSMFFIFISQSKSTSYCRSLYVYGFHNIQLSPAAVHMMTFNLNANDKLFICIFTEAFFTHVLLCS